MKTLRIFLLTLLVLVLPLRGALAAVAHCMADPAAQPAGPAVVQMHQDHGGHDHHHGQAGVQAPESAGAHHSPAGADGATALDACKFCAAYCSVTPVLSTLPSLVSVSPLAETVFPALVTPPPSHLADALDRPPQRF